MPRSIIPPMASQPCFSDGLLGPDGANRVTFITVPQDSSVWTAIENDEAPLTDAELAGFGF